jgi:hypothetical protein
MRPSLRPPWPIKTQLLRWHPRAPQSIPRRIATTSAANAAPIDIPSLILSPGSKHHNSLSSYVAYAKQRKLGPDSPIYVGTHYEYTVALSLLRLGFSLLRVGAKADAGIDLIGHWVLAPLHEPLRVIIQCKARTMSVSPCHLRDLEGSFPGVPPSWRSQDVLGLLITTQKATKGTLKALGESRRPMGFIMISHDGRIQQFVWNRAAAERGLEGVGVTLRHTPHIHSPQTAPPPPKPSITPPKSKPAGTHKDIQLTWLGTPIFPERESLDAETLALMRQIHPKPPFQYYQRVETRVSSTKIDAALRDPEPRGGMVDPESAYKVTKLAMPEESEKRPRGKGRPIGRKNKPKVKPRGRGRPKGSKNKPKGDAEEG